VATAQDIDTKVTGCPTISGNNVCYTTFQGGVSRRGFNPNEPALTQAAVTATTGKTFHKQFSTQLNGAIYAQPLVVTGLAIPGKGTRNVVFVATMRNMVYAFDADTAEPDAAHPSRRMMKNGFLASHSSPLAQTV